MDIQRETELVEQAKKSLKAFDELYEYYLPKIYGYIYNRTSNKDLTQDLVSETFMKALSNLEKYKFKGYSFGAWLYRIAHNNIIDYFRKHPEARHQELDEQVESERLSPNTEAEQEERKKIILEALSKLPDESQQILSLKFFEELSNQEIADILGCRKENLAVKTHRALKALKKVIKGGEFEELLGL